MRGQISAEMLIVLAVVLAVAVFLAVQLTGMTQKFGEETEKTAEQINCQTMLLREGSVCNDDIDCGNTTYWECDPKEGCQIRSGYCGK